MIIKNSYYEETPDLLLYVDHLIDWKTIIPLREMDFADAKKYAETKNPLLEMAPSNTEETLDIYKEVFKQYGEICFKEIFPLSKEWDRDGLKFEKGKVTPPASFSKIINLLAESGILVTAVSREYGGLGMSLVAQSMALEMISRADASLALTMGCVNLGEIIERFASEEIKKEYLPLITSGKLGSAMALTEPNFGSDLPSVMTKAEPVNGSATDFTITGTKRFITHGCGIGESPSAILTLARSKGTGAKGLSFFLVHSNDVEIGGIEHKLGLHVSPTCEVVYDKSKAILIGEQGKGLVKYAMDMMNAARLAIAVQGVGVGQAAYDEASKYASERVQFGTVINQLPAVKRLLNEMECKVHAMRAITYHTAEIVDLGDGLGKQHEIHGGEKNTDIRKYEKLAKLLTPVAKYFTSETANQVAYQAGQVFGGSGFVEDYKVAQLYRDVRIFVIYEGTSQLQVIGIIGSVVEGMREGSILNEYLNTLLSNLKDAKLLSQFREWEKDLTQLVLTYKEKDKDVKSYLAVDVVDYFVNFFISILLAKQVQLAKEKNLSILETKERAFNNFFVLAKRNIAAARSQLTSV